MHVVVDAHTHALGAGQRDDRTPQACVDPQRRAAAGCEHRRVSQVDQQRAEAAAVDGLVDRPIRSRPFHRGARLQCQTQRAERDGHSRKRQGGERQHGHDLGNPGPQRAERRGCDNGGDPEHHPTQAEHGGGCGAGGDEHERDESAGCPGQQDDAAYRVRVRVMIGRGYHQPAGEVDDDADPPEQCGDHEHEPQPVRAKAPDVRQPCADPAEQPALADADDPRRGLLLLAWPRHLNDCRSEASPWLVVIARTVSPE